MNKKQNFSPFYIGVWVINLIIGVLLICSFLIASGTLLLAAVSLAVGEAAALITTRKNFKACR